MFSSILRPSQSRSQRQRRRSRTHQESSPARDRSIFSTVSRTLHRSRQRSFGSYGEDEAITEEEEEDQENVDNIEHDEEGDEEDEEGDDTTPLLPIFSSAHLDTIPVFNLTHVIRELVVARCETTLSWDQLRSPQVSQFLLKPIQQEIRANQFNAGTQYALIANCLQFTKEATLYPGNSGTSKTRAMLCELLAIRLLKEYSTRELIDALSYDFDPLQGQPETTAADAGGRQGAALQRRQQHRVARISCYEVALRAQTKRFLAHPVVVQQLEAIWAGTIVFHAAADSMHRKAPTNRQQTSYGTNGSRHYSKPEQSQDADTLMRRAVTIYNPREASLLKLSRLRVPRYRNILSTLSFAVLLGLFLAVLIQRSLEITTLEVFFWFWAGGYMLDEIVGFNEQGFSLYIASFWNTFDLGILLILFVHLCLRIYGIVMLDVRKHHVANMAYDVLAADAILLFPRLFSVLDHYRYFSQLLIAFRMMAQDLVAVFLLILVSCSGFFVALTLSFGNDGIDSPSAVAYALLQMLMGFTPAAWDRWDGYNTLGKFVLTLFLFICHFLVVTILITVLTNSFMAIIQNANEEHQFVFAVNTISNVKSDALFSYVAPTNIIQWLLTPLRYFVPFRQYVKINRTIIKFTHFPILFTIYAYERTILRSSVYDSIDVVESRGRPKRPFAPKIPRLAREPSIATFRQDRALEEVFRQPIDTFRSVQPSQDRRKTSTVVKNWMQTMGEEVASPPPEQDRKIVDRLERRRPSGRFHSVRRGRDYQKRTMSVASDPEEFVSHADFLSPARPLPPMEDITTPSQFEGPSQQTDADGDDELHTSDNDEDQMTMEQASQTPELVVFEPATMKAIDYFTRKESPVIRTPEKASSESSEHRTKLLEDGSGVNTPSRSSVKDHPRQHMRNVSSATMIYRPTDSGTEHSDLQVSAPALKAPTTAPASGAVSPINKSASSGLGRRSPKRQAPGPTRMRPILPTKDDPAFRSAPHITGVIGMNQSNRQEKHQPSLEMDLVSDIGDNKAIGGGYVGAIPASFATQMFHAGASRQSQQKEEQERFSRLMMARMNSLEEGFRSVIHEMRETRDTMSTSAARSRAESRERVPKTLHREKRKERSVLQPGDKENLDPSRPQTATSAATQDASFGHGQGGTGAEIDKGGTSA